MTIIICFRKEMSAYYLEHAGVDHIHKHFDLFEAEARRLLDSGLAIPAYFSFIYSTFGLAISSGIFCFSQFVVDVHFYFLVMLGMTSF